MIGIVQLAKDRLAQTANPEGVYIDFTMGKGRDTLFLASLVPRGRVFAFDIQQGALDATASLLAAHQVSNVRLILDSHDHFRDYVTEGIDGGLFNLGFLPGGDRAVTTRRSSTLPAVLAALDALKIGGALGVTVYPGHEEGRLEGEELQCRLSELPKEKFDIFLYRLLNVPESPYSMVAERRA